VHALQNHDELTLGLAHFEAHAEDHFAFHGRQLSGHELREQVQREMYDKLIAPHGAPYNLKFGDGVASTSATVAAAAMGIRDISALTPAQVSGIRQRHLLLAFYNAMQPGVFALSGWDLVGALTLPADQVRARLADGDTRWINRGAYDLIGSNPGAMSSAAGMPRAVALYGSLPQQLADPQSFASQLARLLKARAALKLAAAKLIDVPAVQAPGLLVLVHELPEGAGKEVTAINFSDHPVDETVTIAGTAGQKVSDAMDPQGGELMVGAGGRLTLHLDAVQGRAWRIGGKEAP
jgi:trehalose synthase